ncbi:HAMP domain-containing histidine kinase [Streptacidiphilus sp. PB12-B1b]|uniref:sensor histidine kinase n=1 Tax=Streptacidiphilus sp. PB12-B1b TaxID=2705012 RepID=UPI0015F9F29E|nr:HAMP domain-containing sensor histidine kinase [Streptacidiphilus sp. PB12-B1b]QMU75354.1 HAMP domain-containing histidine kinase [Streptacidiphilus sp. PB12-B1b]
MRWALVKVCIAVTTMVALAFLIPLGLMVRETARDRAFSGAERQAAALGPALAITTDQNALQRAVATLQGSGPQAQGGGAGWETAVHVPTRTGLVTIGDTRSTAAEISSAAADGRSGTVTVPGGYAYLQPVAVASGGVAVVEVFIPDAQLDQGVAAAWLVLSGVAVVLVLISVLVADRLGTRIVGSARRLAGAARALGAGDLAVRVPQADDSPPELRDAAAAFNAMADRVVQLVVAERELAADLSHRLRTPLTVLRLNAASLGTGDAAEQTRHAVAQLEREVDQIIRTARGRDDRFATAPAPLSCDAAEVIRDRVGFWSALAEDEARHWQLVGDAGPAVVPVGAADLGAALDALLGNIFRHTPEGTGFTVDVHARPEAVTILVSDAGPGIDDADSALLRGHGHGGEGSTGLGLDIVRRVAQSTGGGVAVGRSVLGGTEIQLVLHTAAAEPGPRAPRERGRRRATPRVRLVR